MEDIDGIPEVIEPPEQCEGPIASQPAREPAPNWTIGAYTQNQLTIPIYEARNGHPVARVWGIDHEAQQRARLIRMAPELLDLVRELKFCVHASMIRTAPDVAREMDRLIRRADAAIAPLSGRALEARIAGGTITTRSRRRSEGTPS